MSSGKFAAVVDFDVDPDRVGEFRTIMLKQARNSLELEVGCRQFDVFADPRQPASFVLYELYDDEAAFELHLASDHFARFAADVEPMVRQRVIRRLHRV